MVVISRKPWLKHSVSPHRSLTVKIDFWSLKEVRPHIPRAHSNPLPHKSPIQVWSRAIQQHCLRNWQIYSPVSGSRSVGSGASLPASRLRCLFTVPFECERRWWCTSQMEVISFEVVPLEAHEQSNCINSSVGVEETEEGTQLDWAGERETAIYNSMTGSCTGA